MNLVTVDPSDDPLISYTSSITQAGLQYKIQTTSWIKSR